MDSKHHIRIVGTKIIPYRNKKTGAPEEIRLAQCVVTSESEDKGQQVIVGELMLPKHLSDTGPGEYLAEFELSVDRDLRVGAKVVAFHPLSHSSPTARATATGPKEQDKKVA